MSDRLHGIFELFYKKKSPPCIQSGDFLNSERLVLNQFHRFFSRVSLDCQEVDTIAQTFHIN